MSKFCKGCGKEMPDDSAFCMSCGTKIEAEAESTSESNVENGSEPKVSNNGGEQSATQEPIKMEAVQSSPQPVVQETPQPAVQVQPVAQPQVVQQPVTQQVSAETQATSTKTVVVNQSDAESGVVGTAYFFFMSFIYCIPVLGWIVCLITAFAPKNQTRKNFAKAMLIWLILALIFSISSYFIFRWISGLIVDYANAQFGSNMEDLGELWEEIISQ